MIHLESLNTYLQGSAKDLEELIRILANDPLCVNQFCSEIEQEQDRRESVARLIWSQILEPAETIIGEVILSLGAEETLLLLARVKTGKEFAQSVHTQLGVDTCTETDDENQLAIGTLSARKLANSWDRCRKRLQTVPLDTVFKIVHHHKIRLLTREQYEWPTVLDDLGSAQPVALWVRGNTNAFQQEAVAVVGSRNMSRYGEQITAEIATGLCKAKVNIVSGGALGVDGVAHRVALHNGTPTVAVLAGGIERWYPTAHSELLLRIADEGAVCSEVALGTPPTRWRFLQRNRLIAALSQITVVTEAGIRSGALNTAGHACELGRKLGAVPGQVTSTASSGCHKLIREYGAQLITRVEDVLEMHPFATQQTLHQQVPQAASTRHENAHQMRVLDAMTIRKYRCAEEIALRSGLTEQEVRTCLAELELFGCVKRSISQGKISWLKQEVK